MNKTGHTYRRYQDDDDIEIEDLSEDIAIRDESPS